MGYLSLCEQIENILQLTDAIGFGVGKSPPPGSNPATALAGARRDRAFDSSGITPAEDHKSKELAHTPEPANYKDIHTQTDPQKGLLSHLLHIYTFAQNWVPD